MNIFKNEKFTNLVCPIFAAILLMTSVDFSSGFDSLFQYYLPEFFSCVSDLEILDAFLALLSVADILASLIFPFIAALFLAYSAVAQKKSIIVPLAFVALSIISGMSTIEFIVRLFTDGDFNFYGILIRVAWIVFDISAFLMAVFCLIGRMNKPFFLKNLWFVPALFHALFVVPLLVYQLFTGYGYYGSYPVLAMFSDSLIDFLSVIAYALIGIFYCYGKQDLQNKKT